MQIYNRELIEITKKSTYTFNIRVLDTQEQITLNVQSEELVLCKLDSKHKDTLIAIAEGPYNIFYIHVKSDVLYCTPYINGDSEGSIDIEIEYYSNRFFLKKELYDYKLVDCYTHEEVLLNSSLFKIGNKKLPFTKDRGMNEPYIYLKIKYFNYVSFLEYTKKGEEFSIKTSRYELYDNPSSLQIDFESANRFTLKNRNFELSNTVIISKLKNNELQILNGEHEFNIEVPLLLEINNRLYVIDENENKKIEIRFKNRADLLFKATKFKGVKKGKGIVIKGYIEYNYSFPINSLITSDGVILGQLQWEDNNRFSVFINKEKLQSLVKIHTSLWFGIGSKKVHSMYLHGEQFSSNAVELSFNNGKRAYVLRINKKKVYTLSIVQALPIYNISHKLKILIADFISKNIPKFFRKQKVNLFFEKESSKASESAASVFEKIHFDKTFKSRNYFILDSKSEDYRRMKKIFKRKIVKRFSIRHYVYLFQANAFISSELSNHVIASRVFSNKLSSSISKTPLYFLQHGIMFAKPVDNPMAMGFHKENVSFNLKKSVISSDLEAKEFYKMGYCSEDLMKTGLPKLDNATLDESADKIAYMPTWRYWEESYIINNEIEKTTYFESIMNLIDLFEKEGLLDKLLITPHNKFVEYVAIHLQKYEDILCKDPKEALEKSRIFITDYSSAIYDSIYRGAYPIFYWKDSHYLIDNYKAIPPINNDNAPGMLVYSDTELINAIRQAVSRNYEVPSEVINKYRKINEFHDGNNSNRVIKELTKNGVL